MSTSAQHSDARRHILGTGFAFPIEGMKFNPDNDYVCCLICGAVYQSWWDRNHFYLPVGLLKNQRAEIAKELRDKWAAKHAKTHSQREHELLRLSGLSMTPEAAKKLTAFGLIPISDMFQQVEEVSAALFESTPVPTNDSEG